MEYQYKILSPDDVPLFRELLAVFNDAFGGEGYEDALPDEAYHQSLLEADHFIALVALCEGRVVGGLAAFLLPKWEQKRKELFIYDLAVAEAHRRKGIATALINNLKGIAKERGAYVIFVQADAGDEPAIKLYESLGKREDVHHFDIPLE